MIFGKTGSERGRVFAFFGPGLVVKAHGPNRAEQPFRAEGQRQINSFRKTRRCRLEKRRKFQEKLTLRVHVPFGACPLSRLLPGLPTASRAAECRGTCLFCFPLAASELSRRGEENRCTSERERQDEGGGHGGAGGGCAGVWGTEPIRKGEGRPGGRPCGTATGGRMPAGGKTDGGNGIRIFPEGT